MIGSSRHSDGRCVGWDYALTRDTVEIEQKHWEWNGWAWTVPEDVAEEQEWHLSITLEIEDYQDHNTPCSFSKDLDFE